MSDESTRAIAPLSLRDLKRGSRRSAVGPAGSGTVSPRPEVSAGLLLVKPPEELLKPCISPDFLDSVESVPQFVMRPGLVNEFFAGIAGRRCFRSAFAPRDHVVPARGNVALTE